MRTLLVVLVLAACCGFAGDEQFNGRWDIKTFGEPRGRAWWLEIEGAGTPNAKGKFVSAYAGDMNTIDEISIRDGVLEFGFFPKERPKPGAPATTRHLVYTARLVDGKLEGTFEVEGQQRPPIKWVGVRAPVINEKDDGTWKEGGPVELFNGKNLTGWLPLVAGKELGWSVKDGLLVSTGGANNIVSERKFWNFKLHVEYRVGAHSNSGVGLRARYEVQVLEDYGRSPDTHSNGALYSRIAPSENASKPAGEWQAYDIRLVGREVTVVLNGKKVIDRGLIEGLTAVATDADEGQPGGIILQGDHGPVEFRKITLTPLVK